MKFSLQRDPWLRKTKTQFKKCKLGLEIQWITSSHKVFDLGRFGETENVHFMHYGSDNRRLCNDISSAEAFLGRVSPQIVCKVSQFSVSNILVNFLNFFTGVIGLKSSNDSCLAPPSKGSHQTLKTVTVLRTVFIKIANIFKFYIFVTIEVYGWKNFNDVFYEITK